ncbi:MAG TPA: GNAT family N-acetyltransferase [Acidimicrobiia bacterium]|jgi:ribosomal protein S18 acetylase RimI-like enzyme|nr:GNAT family N-acetyltransferase [Acidimicrobiia bacterium]
MTNVPEHPASVDGIRWVVPTVKDARRIADLYEAWAQASRLTWRESEEEIRHDMDAPTTDLDDYRCAEDGEGRFVASVIAWIQGVPGWKHRAFLFTASRPGYGHVETLGVQWGEARARNVFAAADDDMERVIRVFSDMRDASRIGRFEAEGYRKARYFVDMVRPLDQPIPQVAVPVGVEIVDWSEEWITPTWETHCEAFADHWGSLPPSPEDWQHRFERPNFRPDLSAVAVADGKAVSYALNGVFPQDWATRGRKEGWIETLGTRRAWRRQGLASALITESMRRFGDDGLDHAALNVDGANPTGAFGVYERLGFTVVDRTVELIKNVAPG